MKSDISSLSCSRTPGSSGALKHLIFGLPGQWRWFWSYLGAVVFSTVGCSGEDAGDASERATPEIGSIDSGLSSSDEDAATAGPDSKGGLTEDGQCRGLTVDEGCAGEVYEGESVPLDLYLMFDQSGSMLTEVGEDSGVTRIDIVRSAVKTFLSDEESTGMGAGIGYFGNQPLRHATCDPEDFTDPAVGIGTLPGLTDEILDSLEAAEPTGETPTGAAIRGACDYVTGYVKEHPTRQPAILLVTDGYPQAPLSEEVCVPTLDDAVEAARECYEEKGVRVYVLGVGPKLTELQKIAEGGGTVQAYLADQDNADQVLEKFRAVRYAAQLPCQLEVSGDAVDNDELDVSQSTVGFLDFDCNYQDLAEVDGKAGCGDQGGWYFDDPEHPQQIHLCDVSCGDVKSGGRQLFYSIGCDLQVVVR